MIRTDDMPGGQLRERGYRLEAGLERFGHQPWRIISPGEIGMFVADGGTPEQAWANAEAAEARREVTEAAARRPFPQLLAEFRAWQDQEYAKLAQLSKQAEHGEVSYAEYDSAGFDMRETAEEWTGRLLAALPQDPADWELIISLLRNAGRRAEGFEHPDAARYANILATLERGA